MVRLIAYRLQIDCKFSVFVRENKMTPTIKAKNRV